MPWSAKDAPKHNSSTKGKPALQKAWAKAANVALGEYDGDEAKALATANKAVQRMVARAQRARRQEDEEEEVIESTEGADDPDPEDEPDEEEPEEDPEDKPEEEPEEDEDEDRPRRSAEGFDRNLDILTRDATNANTLLKIKANSYDPEQRTCDVMISTGARVRRMTWDGEFDELLDVSARSVRLQRLNAGAQFLDAHQAWRGLEAVLGAVVPGTARIEGRELWAKLKLSRNEKGDMLARNLMDGIPVPVSVGYRTHREVIDATTSPPTRTAVDWEPFEVSYAPIPHENGAGIRSASNGHGPQHGEHPMSVRNATGAATAPTAEEKRRAAEAAAAEETRRQEEDRRREADEEVARRAVDDHAKYVEEMFALGTQGKFSHEEIMKAIRAKETTDSFSKRALANIAATNNRGETSTIHGNGFDGDDQNGFFAGNRFVVGINRETHQRTEAMTEALARRIMASHRTPVIQTEAQHDYVQRMGLTDEVVRSWQVLDGRTKPDVERATQFLGASLVELAAVCLGYTGSIRSADQGYELMRRAFMTTSDFPLVLENAMHKVLLSRYQLALPTYREIAIEKRFNDFRDHPMYRVGQFPMLEPINEAGEIRAGAAAESKESARVSPFGKYFPLTRQLLVNDDMSAIDDIIGSAGTMVLNFENIEFYKMFNANPALKTDNKSVFHADHGNLSGAGHEPTPHAVSLGRAAMRKQTDIDNFPLNVQASILLIPGEHETRAEQLVAAISASQTGAVNPFSGKLRPVVEGLIAGHEWYLFANPQVIPNFVYGFLTGATGPRTATDEPFTVQGIRVKVEHDFGVGAIDFRGAYKDTGAAATEPSFPVTVVNADEIGGP